MPRIEVDIDDKGEIVGTAPNELDALFRRTEAAAHGRGYSKGMSEAAEAAKKQIEDNVRAELAKRDAMAPLEKEKYSRIDEENTALKTQLIDREREADKALKAREESHARELLKRADALKKREDRILKLTRGTLRAEALQAGAREESLSELEVILGASIGYDDDMEPFVKNEDGSPYLLHGKPIPIGAYVKQYLDSHPYHRKPAPGQGGNARGGAAYSGARSDVTMDAAVQRIQQGDRSADAINDVFEASRRRRQAS